MARGAFSVVQDLSSFQPLNVRGYVIGDTAAPVLTASAVPGTATRDGSNGGTHLWESAGGVAPHVSDLQTDDGNYIFSDGVTGLTQYINTQSYGFAIPGGATINGISVYVHKSQWPDPSGGATVFDNAVRLIKTGAVQATDRSNGARWPYPDNQWFMYGGPTDLWGTAWAPADINAAGFGFAMAASCTNAQGQINMIQIWVYYSTASLPATAPWMLLGRKAIGATNTIDHWDVPLVRPSSSSQLGVGTGTGVFLTQTTNAARAALNPTPGPRWTNFDGLLYGISYDDLGTGGTANDVNSNYVTWKTKLTTLPLGESAGTVPTILTNAPQGAYDVKGWQQRLWLLGGIDIPGGGTTHSSTTLFYTNPIASGGGTASADWKDPVAGTTNLIKMDQNSHDFGVGLGTVRNGLLVFRRNSIYLLRGTTPATYALTLVSKEHGCIDARSIVETDQGCYFLSTEGLLLTDGVTVKNVSGTCEFTLQQAIGAEQAQVLALTGGYATGAIVPGGAILVSIGTYQVSGGVPTGKTLTLWNGLYDRRTNTWIRVTSQLWATDSVQQAGNTYPGPVCARISPALTLAVGDQYVTNLAGLGNNVTSALYDQLPSGGSPYVSIPMLWKSRYAELVSNTTLTRKFGQAKRFFTDYVFAGSGILPTTGFSHQAADASGNALGPALLVPVTATEVSGSVSTVTPATAPTVGRANQDFANEVSDLAFNVTWSDSARAAAPIGVIAELYGVGVEFQPTRDLR